MIVSHKHKFIFIHIPKTAGTSIERSLTPMVDDNDIVSLSENVWRPGQKPGLYLHSNIKTVCRLLPQCKEYFKFSFVRNPWERQVSLFCNLTQTKRFGAYTNVSFKEWLLNDTIKPKYGMPTFLSIRYKRAQQVNWVSSTTGMQMDFIGRFENLRPDFERICKQIGVSVPLLHENKTEHSHYLTYYDQESLDTVTKWMNDDIDCFGYTVPKL